MNKNPQSKHELVTVRLIRPDRMFWYKTLEFNVALTAKNPEGTVPFDSFVRQRIALGILEVVTKKASQSSNANTKQRQLS